MYFNKIVLVLNRIRRFWPQPPLKPKPKKTRSMLGDFVGKKLYVGNLPYRTTDGDLHQLFSQAGNVDSAKVISDRETGRSKGFGFVEMSSDSEADEAVRRFNGSNMDGRKINVNEARPQAPRESRGFDRAPRNQDY